MDLTRHVEELLRQLSVAAAAGGDDARQLAERLTAPLESAARLVLLDALSAAADEITRELAPGSVDVRLRGRDPEFVVTTVPTDHVDGREHRAPEPGGPGLRGPAPEGDEGGTSRITLRLPEQLKGRIEDAAGRESLSVNTWLVRTVGAAVDPPDLERREHGSSWGGQRYTGWAR